MKIGPKGPETSLQGSKQSQKEIFFEEKKKAEDFVKEIKKFTKMRKESEKFLETQADKLKRKAKWLQVKFAL